MKFFYRWRGKKTNPIKTQYKPNQTQIQKNKQERNNKLNKGIKTKRILISQNKQNKVVMKEISDEDEK